MKVGEYADGRDVDYDEASGQFAVGGLPVTTDQVLVYDGSEQIKWSSDETRDWARALGAPAAATVSAVSAVADAAPEKKGWFTRLPMWGKILFVLVWPISVCYGVYWMWKDKKYSQPIRILLTAGAVLLFVIGATNQPSGTSGMRQASTDTSPASTAPEPTKPAEPAPAPVKPKPVTAVDVVNAAFGTFAPVVQTGSGDGVITVPPEAGGAMVTASHSGKRNFVVEGLDANNQMTGLFVNTIGAYNGVTMFTSDDKPVKLKVTASGNWSVTISPLAAAPPATASNSGAGDAVLLYDGPAADWTISHSGSRNFAVKYLSSNDNDLLVNEIGAYSGVVPAAAGPGVITISADGAWTMVPK